MVETKREAPQTSKDVNAIQLPGHYANAIQLPEQFTSSANANIAGFNTEPADRGCGCLERKLPEPNGQLAGGKVIPEPSFDVIIHELRLPEPNAHASTIRQLEFTIIFAVGKIIHGSANAVWRAGGK